MGLFIKKSMTDSTRQDHCCFKLRLELLGRLLYCAVGVERLQLLLHTN